MSARGFGSLYGEPHDSTPTAIEARLADVIAERDLAREECGHAKAMRASISEEMMVHVRAGMDAKVEIERLKAELAIPGLAVDLCRLASRLARHRTFRLGPLGAGKWVVIAQASKGGVRSSVGDSPHAAVRAALDALDVEP